MLHFTSREKIFVCFSNNKAAKVYISVQYKSKITCKVIIYERSYVKLKDFLGENL
jgi:hypothetical protein